MEERVAYLDDAGQAPEVGAIMRWSSKSLADYFVDHCNSLGGERRITRVWPSS